MDFLSSLFSAPYEKISANDYHTQYYKTKTDHALIDVRTKAEFKSGHLPDAVNIPLDELHKRIQEIPQDKPVVLVCATGNRSGSAAGMLVKAGYAQVYNLVGGTMSWRMHRFPLE